jgi:hypothetical protein
MNNIFKVLNSDSVQDAVSDVIDILVIERLKEDYILCLDTEDKDVATAILTVLRYFMVYDDFKDFLAEVRDAGYNVERK